MKPGKPLKRGKPMRRTRMRPTAKAKEKKADHQDRMGELRPVAFARALWKCEAAFAETCSTGLWWLEAHHRLPSGNGGPDTLENLVALCNHCHHEVHHVRPGAARERGLLLWTSDGAPAEAWADRSETLPRLDWWGSTT